MCILTAKVNTRETSAPKMSEDLLDTWSDNPRKRSMAQARMELLDPRPWCFRCQEAHDPGLHYDRWQFDRPNLTGLPDVIDEMVQEHIEPKEELPS
jgi:hypothetical protein